MTEERSPQPPQTVKSYAGGIAARTAARQEERKANPLLPNLAQAAVTYRPEHGPQTLADMGAAQRADAATAPEPGKLSGDTIAGLQAVYAASQAQQAKQSSSPPPVPPAAPPAGSADDDELDPEDEAFALAMRGAKIDIIQNERERAAVAQRVKEIDLADGLLTGEFTQVVPIVPDKLTVKFRCLTPGENNELRLFLFDQITEDPRKRQLGNELLAFYQTVATVVEINRTLFVKHMVAQAPSGKLVFNKEVFEQKVNAFMAYPMPLIASIGTHSGWFDMRVRELFATTDRLKNG
jgi:hypothetical protein